MDTNTNPAFTEGYRAGKGVAPLDRLRLKNPYDQRINQCLKRGLPENMTPEQFGAHLRELEEMASSWHEGVKKAPFQ
jgi:hypothetical protein